MFPTSVEPTQVNHIPTRAAAAVLCIAALTLLVPLGIRALNAQRQNSALAESYLPALEGPRERQAAFDTDRVPDLRRLNPGYVVIGDSMAGTRMDERRLGELSGRPVAPLLQPGSGSAFWYLALKNWARPRRARVSGRSRACVDGAGADPLAGPVDDPVGL